MTRGVWKSVWRQDKTLSDEKWQLLNEKEEGTEDLEQSGNTAFCVSESTEWESGGNREKRLLLKGNEGRLV